MAEKEQVNCSFCGRPRRLALYLVMGPQGRNICDLCVLEAKSRAAPVESGPWGARCSFCGKSADEAPLILQNDEAGICANCVESSRHSIERVLGDGAELLHEKPNFDGDEMLAELNRLAASFVDTLQNFLSSFEKGDIDWNAYNLIAQTIPPLKSKASLMKLDKISDILWEIESLFHQIHFDDLEHNRQAIEKMAEVVAKLPRLFNMK